jgi:hypothetical protein
VTNFSLDDLQEGASQFQQQAVKLKRKYWWENIKVISDKLKLVKTNQFK